MENERNSEEWQKARDSANKATMASSQALQNDALTRVESDEALDSETGESEKKTRSD
ncbi:MAG: hypothetical protein HKN36_07020 [Hellea sp.]|nr:hypothetical protein [Hellea sp.]